MEVLDATVTVKCIGNQWYYNPYAVYTINVCKHLKYMSSNSTPDSD